MDPLFQDYLQRLIDVHQDILTAIEGLSLEALDWIPVKSSNQEATGDMNSINVLVTHLCGAERYWIGDVACDDRSMRVRSEEFEVHGMNAILLAEKINQATDFARRALEKINADDLSIEKTQMRDGRPITVGWALLHALEHTAIHLGHIQITRQLWDEK